MKAFRFTSAALSELREAQRLGDGDQDGIHWPDLNEDISVENLILREPSDESRDQLNNLSLFYFANTMTCITANEF